ncbi:MAG TPA: hypothetical protein VFA71_03790 [Terriglobales bacterium]|nr:hypothetical protein [Terriglobales bacterium]
MRLKTRHKFYALLLICALAGFIGCSSWERDTMQSLAASQGVINQAFDDYNSGKIEQTPQNHNLLITARSKHNDVTQLFLSYVKIEQATQGQKCDQGCKDTLAKAQAGVAAALLELGQIVQAVDDLVKQKPTPKAQSTADIGPMPAS